MIECNKPTTHYSSGRALLLAYDFRRDNQIDAGELAKAKDDQVAGKITIAELDFIKQASVQESIDIFCPPQESTLHTLLVVVVIAGIVYLLSKMMGRK